jgi:hypothetical protein
MSIHPTETITSHKGRTGRPTDGSQQYSTHVLKFGNEPHERRDTKMDGLTDRQL